jgi:hypothetical protein
MSGPKTDARMVLAVPLNVLCPDVYEGKFGVFQRGVQFGSDVVAELISLARGSRMAVIGRQ